MLIRTVTISAQGGAHARPVAELVRLAQGHAPTVTLRVADGRETDLTSVLAVMDLALEPGDEVVLQVADAPGSDALLDDLVAVLAPTPELTER
ncbi:HPr family phosphocarrier protein [Microbacterium sp. A196]|uniref:HPr family phosphocarrier protein n=1 Tax=Microbacterium sp. A196 TaxID=3457320 RepID=UPI003FD59A10